MSQRVHCNAGELQHHLTIDLEPFQMICDKQKKAEGVTECFPVNVAGGPNGVSGIKLHVKWVSYGALNDPLN